ncbi:MAG TPA: hypothetical protein PLS90_03435 [Candidatus Sumerlaeota bacterium]|nr:hypothetical protein [Candidatus Sumerlaeota bacterium]
MLTTERPTVRVNDRLFDAGTLRILDLHADYQCANTGHCCGRAWNIRISDREHGRLTDALRRAGRGPEEIERHFFAAGGDGAEQRWQFARAASGRCIFNGAGACGESTCNAQRELGHEVLPDVCQSFPRLAVATPAGIYLTLSYTCPTAVRSLLSEDRLAEVAPRAVFQHHPRLQGASFGPGAELPWFGQQPTASWEAWDYFWRWASQFAARAEFTPAQALYLIGQAVAHVERNAPATGRLDVLVDLLDQIGALPAADLRRHCAAIAPLTELGATYLSVILNVLASCGVVPEILRGARETLARPGSPEREALLREYDARVRPRLAEFERIERNWVASRLYANPLIYQAKHLRVGYFLAVLNLIQWRFTVLLLALRDGTGIEEQILLRAAAETDHLLQHNAAVTRRMLELLRREAAAAALEHLARPALF